MVSYNRDYMERVYAGWLGKVIGVRHGANIENWTYEKINRSFGEITDYLYDFENFAADDDINGPLSFMRALADSPLKHKLTEEDMSQIWLNYIADGHGFFWWGGYGISTEHTAYLNVLNGIDAPESGSAVHNTLTVAEQIGGQIFSDIWGLVAPNDPPAAADLAKKMSAVSHDFNGKYGGMYVAACISAAFEAKSVKEIMEAGLSTIPADSAYKKVVHAIIDFHASDANNNWRDCFHFIKENYGYDKYPGVCHIIPNAAVMALGMLYGEGDFSKTINITNMCGWDTDCNVGNVGAILGTFVGLNGIETKWTKPINDFVCASSVVGSRNIRDIASIAKETVQLSKRYFFHEEQDATDEYHFDFELPGSTHAFRTAHSGIGSVMMQAFNSDEQAYTGKRSLKVVSSILEGGGSYRTYLQTYYRPDDFDDARYDPSFSPIFYPGQTVSMNVFLPSGDEEQIAARLYVKDAKTGKLIFGPKETIPVDEWTDLTWKVPAMENVIISEVGIECIPTAEEFGNPKTLVIYLDNVELSGSSDYSVAFETEHLEMWQSLHQEVSQLTHLRGYWTLENGKLSGSHASDVAEAYTGAHYFRDYRYQAKLTPVIGETHGLLFRVQGAARSYAVVLRENTVSLIKKEERRELVLDSKPYNYSTDTTYDISIDTMDDQFRVSIDGEAIFDVKDSHNPYLSGQVGFLSGNGSRTYFDSYRVTPIKRG